MNIYFISDLHFGHTNCLTYDNRPFLNITEHDNEIIRRWNDKVKDEDVVWILGDVSWYSPNKTVEILQSLKGRKCLCEGNHDRKYFEHKPFRYLFEEIVDYKEIFVPDLPRKKKLIISHYPIPCFKNHYYGWYHLYGHVHKSFEANMMERIKREMIELYKKDCNMYNVGCMMDYMDYTPQTITEIIEKESIQNEKSRAI